MGTMTLEEVAAATGISYNAVRKLIQLGDLPAIRISPRKIRVRRDVFERWLASRAVRGGRS